MCTLRPTTWRLAVALAAAKLSDEDFTARIWPTIVKANEHTAAFSRIDRRMIVPMPADREYPRTDKGNIIRVQVYSEFSDAIEEAYSRFESSRDSDNKAGPAKWSLDEDGTENWLRATFEEKLGIVLEDRNQDFYEAGVDSLGAVQMWSIIKKEFDLGGREDELSQNVVFEHPTRARLARHLYELRTTGAGNKADSHAAMRRLIERYSVFEKHVPGPAPTVSGDTVVSEPACSRCVGLNCLR